MQSQTFSSHIRLIFIHLFVVLFVFFTYTFLHESGHAIVGFMLGQSLTEFNINFWDLSAHVGMAGGELTASQLAVQAMAGGTLPLLVWATFISLVPRKASFVSEALKLISSLAVLNTLLAWIILPVLYVIGMAPPSDDVTHFLHYSQMPPLLLTFIVIMIYISGWAYFLSKIDGLRNEFLLLQVPGRETVTSGIRNIIPMIGIMAFCLVLVFVLNGIAINNPLSKFSPPSDFESVAEIDLSAQTYSAQMLAEFTVDVPVSIGVFVTVRNINTSYFDLSVVGADGYSSAVLHGEGYSSNRDGGLWEQNLKPGNYQLVLTSNQSPGTASVYLKVPGSK